MHDSHATHTRDVVGTKELVAETAGTVRRAKEAATQGGLGWPRNVQHRKAHRLQEGMACSLS